MGAALSCGEMITVSLRLAALCHERCGVGGFLPPWLPASTLLCAFAGALGSEARAVKCSTHRASVDACVKRLHDGHVRKGVRLG